MHSFDFLNMSSPKRLYVFFPCISLNELRTVTIMRARFKEIFMNLNTLCPAPGSRKARKRVARGNSAGGGTTAGRGTKGQHSRTGSGRRFGFEGGQTPLLRRQPKFGGFTNPNRKEYEVLNLSTLEEKLASGSYDQAALREARVVRTKKPIKLLGRGEVSKKYMLTVDAASTKAAEAISKAGGKVTASSN